MESEIPEKDVVRADKKGTGGSLPSIGQTERKLDRRRAYHGGSCPRYPRNTQYLR
jgi:hypothetical protein